MTNALQPGDRIRLSGGYDAEPVWRGAADHHDATVLEFIAGQNAQPAAIVEFDEQLHTERGDGRFAVLELRFDGAIWEGHGIVHIELCNFRPEPRGWCAREQGMWIESHARYLKLTSF